MDVTCPCGTTFQTRNPRAKFCPGKPCAERFRKRRQRGGGAVASRPYTRTEAVEDVAAACGLLPVDIALLEQHFPDGEDAAMDELIGGLAAHLMSLERLRSWLAGGL